MSNARMKIRFYMLLLGTICTLLLAVAGARFALCSSVAGDDKKTKAGRKLFNRVLVEGLQVSKHGCYGIDLVKCGSCRLEKRRNGFLTFGGLNVLTIEDLQVVLPPRPADALGEEGDAMQENLGLSGVAESLGVSKGFLCNRGVPYKFSGLRINSLSVSRLSEEGQGVQKVFSAEVAEGVRGGLSLSGCMVFPSRGSGEFVGKATLVKSGGGLRLAWHGGEIRL